MREAKPPRKMLKPLMNSFYPLSEMRYAWWTCGRVFGFVTAPTAFRIPKRYRSVIARFPSLEGYTGLQTFWAHSPRRGQHGSPAHRRFRLFERSGDTDRG